MLTENNQSGSNYMRDFGSASGGFSNIGGRVAATISIIDFTNAWAHDDVAINDDGRLDRSVSNSRSTDFSAASDCNESRAGCHLFL